MLAKMSASARNPLPSLRGLIELERVSKLYPARVDELVYAEGMSLFPSSWMFAWCRITYRCCQSSKTPDKNLELMINLEGATVLHYAAMRNDTRAAEMLLHRGARVNVINADGRTPLMLAAMFGHREIAVLLVSWRARASVTDALGLDAAAWANLRGYTTIGEVLASVSAAPRQLSSPPPPLLRPSSSPSQPVQSQRPAPKPSPPPTSSHSAQRQPARPTPPSPPSNGGGGSSSAHHGGGAHVGPAAPMSDRPLSPAKSSQSISAVATIPLMMAVQSLQSNRFSGQIPEPVLVPSREPFSPPPRPVYALSPYQQRVARAREAASIRGRLHPCKDASPSASPSANGSRLHPCIDGVLTWMGPAPAASSTATVKQEEASPGDLETGGAALTEVMPGGGYGGGGPGNCRSRPKSATDFGDFAGFADTYVGYGGFISGRSVRPSSAPSVSASAPTTSSLEGTTTLVTTLAERAESPVRRFTDETTISNLRTRPQSQTISNETTIPTDETTISSAQSAQRRNWVVSARRWVQEKPQHSLSPVERHDEHLLAQERLYVVPPYWQRGGGGK